MTIGEILDIAKLTSDYLNGNVPAYYKDNKLANDWRRITKVCEEAGEVWEALSKATGDNPRKPHTGNYDDVLKELGDVAFAAICAIYHITDDTELTGEVLDAAAMKAKSRISKD